MARKTFDVEALKTEVNRRNQESTCNADKRAGWNSMLEEVLHSTGNYKGFGFLTPDKVPEGKAPGIRENRGAFPLAIGNLNEDAFKGCDETRRVYF